MDEQAAILAPKWYVTYGDQILVAGPFYTALEAQIWLNKQEEDYPHDANEWDKHVIEQLTAEELAAWGYEV